MTVSLTHSTPADGTFSATGATAWDAQHVLTQDTARLLGRTTAGVGATEEISVGTGLSLSGGTLTNTVTATAPGGSNTQIQYNNAGAFGGASGLTTNGTNLTLGSASQLLWSTDLILTRKGNASLQLGAADAAGSSITVSSVDTTAETVTLSSAHGLSSGAAVQFTTTTTLPGGITAGTTYYVRVTSTTAFELYDTYGNAVAASGTTGRINITSAGTGTHTCNFGLPFQQLSLQDFTGTNIPGQPFVITGSQGTGTGAGGSIIFQVAPAGLTGTAQNALATALTIGATEFSVSYGQATPFLSINSSGLAQFRSNNPFNFSDPSSTNRGFLSSEGARFGSGQSVGWDSSTAAGAGARDLALFRDAANTLALRNGTNAQTFNVYNTYTSSTNFERFRIVAQSAAAVLIGTEKGSGGGTARALELQTDGTSRWSIGATTGHLLAAADNTYDIGAENGAGTLNSSPRSVISNRLVAGTNGIRINGGSNNGVQINQTGNGILRITNWGVTDFDRLQFGGTDATFPALKRSSTTLQVRLADDTGFGSIQAQNVTAQNNVNAANNFVITSYGSLSTTNTNGQWKIMNAAGSVGVVLDVTTTSVASVRPLSGSGYGTLDAQLRSQGTAPAANNSTGTAGDIRYDADYIYVCTATDTWKRVAIATWP